MMQDSIWILGLLGGKTLKGPRAMKLTSSHLPQQPLKYLRPRGWAIHPERFSGGSLSRWSAICGPNPKNILRNAPRRFAKSYQTKSPYWAARKE